MLPSFQMLGVAAAQKDTAFWGGHAELILSS